MHALGKSERRTDIEKLEKGKLCPQVWISGNLRQGMIDSLELFHDDGRTSP
jgi:hypothetical protein